MKIKYSITDSGKIHSNNKMTVPHPYTAYNCVTNDYKVTYIYKFSLCQLIKCIFVSVASG